MLVSRRGNKQTQPISTSEIFETEKVCKLTDHQKCHYFIYLLSLSWLKLSYGCTMKDWRTSTRDNCHLTLKTNIPLKFDLQLQTSLHGRRLFPFNRASHLWGGRYEALFFFWLTFQTRLRSRIVFTESLERQERPAVWSWSLNWWRDMHSPHLRGVFCI